MAYTTIAKPNQYFNTKLYTGNATGRTISGVGFQPDWTWIKNRSDTSGHRLLDAVRGGTKELIANGTNAEITEAQSLQSWNSDGFVLGTAAGVNANTNNFVAWNWLANGAGSSNTDGSYTSTVSASTTSGFSIVKFTGTGSDGSVGHGLGVTPSMIIVKNLDGTTSWTCYHKSLGTSAYIQLNTTNASASASGYWGTVDSNSFGVTSGHTTLANNYIAYCFAEKKGFSKFVSYTGNGSSTDGAFVYTGFKPAFVLVKNTTTSGYSWPITDNKRETFNDGANSVIWANHDTPEDTNAYDMNFFSNGFKINTASNNFNQSGATYIYMAFAENPIVTTDGLPATAR